jgi:hypothetical protein
MKRPLRRGEFPLRVWKEPPRKKGPTQETGSFSEKGRPTRMTWSATENKRTAKVRKLPSRTLKDPSKKGGSNKIVIVPPRGEGPPG